MLTETRLTTDDIALRQDLNNHMPDINRSIHLTKSDTNNDNPNLEMKINETYSALYERMEYLQNLNETINEQLYEPHKKKTVTPITMRPILDL